MNTIAKTYQDGTYANRNPGFGDASAEWKVTSALGAIKKFGIPHTSLAEVGCGGGAIIRAVSTALNSDRAVGYEPMPEAYAKAKERATDRLLFLNETVTRNTRDDFDLVLCFDVFEHVEDYFEFIRNLKNLSKRFLFHIPLDMSVQMVARMHPLISIRESVGHIHYFSKDTALAALSECGLQIQGHFYTCGADSAYGSLRYRMLKWPRKFAFLLNQDLAVRFLGGYSLMVYATNENQREHTPEDLTQG